MPKPYFQKLPRQLKAAKISETKATCFQCVMTKKKDSPKDWYKPELRCCTYEPFIPNFLVGFALMRGDSSLKDYIRQQIKSAWALPIGIVPHPEYQIRFNTRDENDFGHREDLLCQHLDRSDLSCRVWQIRGSVCSTFFCKSSYGNLGRDFWARLMDYLSLMEMTILEECLSRHGFSPREQNRSLEFLNMKALDSANSKLDSIEDSDPRTKSVRFDEPGLPCALGKSLWRDWFTEKEKFYELCYEWSETILRKEFLSILPPEGKELEKYLVDLAAKMEMR